MVKLGIKTGIKRIAATALAIAFATTGWSQSLLRDAGIEYALDTVALPVMVSSNLYGGRVKVLVVNDLSLNAFVTTGNAVYIHAGLLLRLRSPDELQAVIAHELAHITNGHMVRRSLNAETAQLTSKLGLAFGLAAGALSGEPTAGLGIAAGAAGSARGVFFGHTREEEAAADRSGMRFLARAGIDPISMARVMAIFAGQEDLTPGRQDPYLRTHPLSRDRIRAIDTYAEVLGPRTSDQDKAKYWFDRAQAKLGGYLRDPDYTFRRYPSSDTSDAAAIGRAMARYKLGQVDAAFREIDPLIERHPEDPYLQELKGWIAMESNRFDTARSYYAKAAELAPREPQILAGYGRALLAENSKASDAKALQVLQNARIRDGQDARLLRDLSLAYARAGQPAMASLHTAERYMLLRDPKDALVHARRAEGALPTGSPAWNRAQDIITAAERQTKNRR